LKTRRPRRCLGPVERLDRQVLQNVSRSFYLSLRLLPRPMRSATAVGYLLARASDTLADTEAVPVDERLELLDGFTDELSGRGAAWRQGRRLAAFIARQHHAGERVLLERLDECFVSLRELDALQADAVRETVSIILSGQRLDLLRFEEASASQPRCLKGEEELEDYCYRVAGCVGAFWTRIGFLTLGSRFSDSVPADLSDLGVRYGMGLQLVNILRDLREDLTQGRCYLPVADPLDRAGVSVAHETWKQHAAVWLESGRRYASRLKVRRLRAASVLPALIGEDTLAMLDPEIPRAKVTRAAVRRALWRSWWWPRGS
jgi:farnesyl-diphosphate farnesyltransferase